MANLTIEASSLEWMTTGNGLWAARIDDLSGNSVVFSEGYTPVISNKLVKVTNATRPTGTLSYTGSGNGVTATVPLYGINNVADTEDCVTGALTRNIGSADFSSFEWVEGEGTWTATVSGIKADTTNVMSSNGYGITVSGTNVTVTSSTSPTGMFHYEKASASVSTEATQTMAMTSGINTLGQSDMGRRASFDLTYRGIDYTLALDSSHKYGFRHGSTGSILTGASSQAVVAGSDMVVDVTRLVNGDSAKVNAITLWDNIPAAYPEYAQYVSYNPGQVVGLTPRVFVNSHMRNQIIQNGDFSDGTNNWVKGQAVSDYSVSNGVMTLVRNSHAHMQVTVTQSMRSRLFTYHRLLIHFDLKLDVPAGGAASGAFRVGYIGDSTTQWLNSIEVNGSFPWTSYTSRVLLIPDQSKMYFGLYRGASNAILTEGCTVSLRNIQVVDLTEMFGLSSVIASIQTWDDLVAIDASYATYCAYNTGEVVLNAGYTHGGSMTASAPLHGVGTARDTENGVDGKRTAKIGYANMGNLTWNYYYAASTGGLFAAKLTDANVSSPTGHFATSSKYYDKHITNHALLEDGEAMMLKSYQTLGIMSLIIRDSSFNGDYSSLKASLNGKYIYYELRDEDQTTSDITPSSISMQQGTNVLTQTDGGRTADFTLNYDGTDYDIATDASRKYIKRINGTDDYVTGGSPVAVRGKRDKLVDLTYMFGAGYEPATLAAFYKLFPTWRGYDIPHDKGSVLNFKGTGIVSVGFNLVDFGGRTLGAPQNTALSNTTVRGPFDETKYYVGFTHNNYYNPTVVASYTVTSTMIQVKEISTNAYYGVSFPIRVIPGMTYRFENYVNELNFTFYTYNGEWISSLYGQYVEAPENAYWCLIGVIPKTSGTTVTWTNPCVHLQWSGTRNGDYEQYWDYTRPLPTLTYFPNGMNGLNSVSDEVTSRQAVQRLAMAFLEDIDWTVSDGTWTYQFADMKPDTANIAATHSQSFTLSGNTVTFTSQPTGYLVYELATPVVTVFQDEQNLSYQVSDYGTESILPVNTTTLTTAPLRAMIQYLEDAARTMTHLPENYQSQKSMDAFCQAMGDYFGCTITATYNENTRSYSYSFTANN